MRLAYIIESSPDKKRHVCIDAENEATILQFLQEDPARMKKFQLIKALILRNIRNTELYDKENIDRKTKHVTAMKLFKGGQNIRLYCKEQSDANGTFHVIVAELLPKKKDQKVKARTKTLIQKVAGYVYKIEERNQHG